MEPSDSSSTGHYSDGVYDKVEAQTQYAATNKPLPALKPPMLPAVMLVCLVLLFISCFIGILVSGLHFGHQAASDDCLGQSWVMFSVRSQPKFCCCHRSTGRADATCACFARLANPGHSPSWASCTSHCTCKPPSRANPSLASSRPRTTRFTRPPLSLRASMPLPGLFR